MSLYVHTVLHTYITVVSLVYERPLLLSRQGTVRHTPVMYDVSTAWYNYTRRDGTTYAVMLLSRNGTKTGRYMILAYDVMQSVRCSGA